MNRLKLLFLFFCKLSFLKILNIFKIFFSYFFSNILKKPYRAGMPLSVSVEPTNYCNLKCPQCPVGRGRLARPKGYMSLDLFSLILKQTAPYLTNMFFYFQGEPFFNPHLFDMIEKANKRKVFTALSTNGHYLTVENVNKILDSGLDYIIISVDGTTQETYEKYRKNGNLRQVIDGIKKLISAKKRKNSKRPFVELQFLVFAHNEYQMEEMKDLASKLEADKLSFKSAQIMYDFEQADLWLPTNVKFNRYENKNGKWVLRRKLKNRCWRLWNSVVFTWDGYVLPCCYDKDGKYAFGNIKNTPLKELVRNENFKSFARELLKNREKIDICRNCGE